MKFYHCWAAPKEILLAALPLFLAWQLFVSAQMHKRFATEGGMNQARNHGGGIQEQLPNFFTPEKYLKHKTHLPPNLGGTNSIYFHL